MGSRMLGVQEPGNQAAALINWLNCRGAGIVVPLRRQGANSYRLFWRHSLEMGSRLRGRPGAGESRTSAITKPLSGESRSPEPMSSCSRAGSRLSPESAFRHARFIWQLVSLVWNIPAHDAFVGTLGSFALAVGRGMEASAPNQIPTGCFIQPLGARWLGDFASSDPSCGSDQQMVTGRALVPSFCGIILQSNPCRGVVQRPGGLIYCRMRIPCSVDAALGVGTSNC
jgi:hypothetical protein